MYLKVAPLNDGDEEKLRRFLNNHNIPFKEYDYALEEFYDLEATWRLEMYLDNKGLTESMSDQEVNDFIDKYHDDLAEAFFNDEYIISGDALDDVTREIVANGQEEDDE